MTPQLGAGGAIHSRSHVDYHHRFCELDTSAAAGGTRLFVEVSARGTSSDLRPSSSVGVVLVSVQGAGAS